MALLIKNKAGNRFSNPQTGGGQAVLDQWIQVSRPALTLPASTTQQIFRVYGGRVLVHLLLAEVTTVIEGTDPVSTVRTTRLTDAGALSGTVYVVASTLDMSSDEVGTIYTIEGDGTAILSPQLAGSGNGSTVGPWIMPQGQIVHRTTATKTGALKWDIWYQPLDSGAYVISINTATAEIT